MKYFFFKENLVGSPFFPGISGWRDSQPPPTIEAGYLKELDQI